MEIKELHVQAQQADAAKTEVAKRLRELRGAQIEELDALEKFVSYFLSSVQSNPVPSGKCFKTSTQVEMFG